jgi:hypothetical protein
MDYEEISSEEKERWRLIAFISELTSNKKPYGQTSAIDPFLNVMRL